MTNPIIIFAKSPDYKGAWDDFERCAISSNGQILDPCSMAAAIIVLADDTELEDIELEFDPGEPVFGVEHGGNPPDDEQKVAMGKWPHYDNVASFSHIEGNYFYEKLKILLGNTADDAMRQAAVADLVSRCTVDAGWLILNEFAMVQQIKLLDPGAGVTAFETTIKDLKLGAKLFERLKNGESATSIINDEMARLIKEEKERLNLAAVG